MKNAKTTTYSIFAATITAALFASAPVANAGGLIYRGMVAMDELQAEQERERAELAASQERLDESRRALAAMEERQMQDWIANGAQGPCPVQFDPNLLGPEAYTPEMQAFFAQHPEALTRPCNPTQMIFVPTPEMSAEVMRIASECMNSSWGGSFPYAPAPMPYIPTPPSSGSGYFPVFIP